jgi:squalene synthase HpnC
MRHHLAAIYAFARTADDFADEPGLADEERLRLLDEWELRLEVGGTDLLGGHQSDRSSVLVFQALHHTIETFDLPVQLFRDLLDAFRQDVTTRRYDTWTDVLDYCRRSANPVGRLVLRVAGYDDRGLDRQSDAVCTALQLTNFWQDLDRDWRDGRLYVPLDDCGRMGARDTDLDARRMTPEWRATLAEMVQRTRELFDVGRAVCDGVHGRLCWELRATWLGGRRILDKLQGAQFDVFGHRPTLGPADAPALLWQLATWPPPRR